jgi:arylsulfatase A-like enzyme
MTNRKNLTLAALLGTSLPLSGKTEGLLSPATRRASRPNILFLMTDDQDFAAVGACGPHAFTPRIEALAREGMLFKRAYVTSSACSPSRYSMLTGRLASRGQGGGFESINPPGTPAYITNDAIDLELDRPNFVRTLQEHGYRTGFFGKWHLGPHNPAGLGVERIARGRRLGEPEVDAQLRENHRLYAEYISRFGFDVVDRVYWNNVGEWSYHVEGLDAQNLEWKIEGALDFLDAAAEEEAPFLLWFAMVQPHNPSAGVREYAPLVGSERTTPVGYLEEIPEVMPARETLSERIRDAGVPPRPPRELTCQRYGNEYSLWIDDGVGALLDRLEETGVAENTIVIYISDNPTWGKFHTYERGTLVPMIVRWPGKVAAGSVNDHLFSNTDFAATLLAAADIPMPEDAGQDSVNQLPSLLQNRPARESLFLEFGNSRAVSDGTWKYIAIRYTDEDRAFAEKTGLPLGHWGAREGDARFKGLAKGWREANLGFFPAYWETDQLYFLPDDPMEQNNLAGHPESRPHLERMRRLMAQKIRDIGRPFGEFTNKGY